MLSFKKALIRNVGIELDVRILKDNNIVVYHDTNLFRMTGVNKNIEKCTYEEIKDLRLANTNNKIPLLKDVLDLINNKVLILIEIKTNNFRMKKNLIKILDNYDNFIIHTFNINTIYWLKLYRPNYILGLITTRKRKMLFKVNFVSLPLFNTKKKYIDKLRRKKIVIFIWSINNQEEIKKALKIGDSFIVDYY